jgi:catechol 2,3-dioxygenase-like lactoylglutathione lyase family enzyme
MKAIFKNAFPYQKDNMKLPVKDVERSIPFYETTLGFKLISRETDPYQSAILSRDNIQIGLAENGGDPSQDGCFFEVDNVEKAMTELKANGLKQISDYSFQKHGTISWKVFFVIAPDELCYCIGERQS